MVNLEVQKSKLDKMMQYIDRESEKVQKVIRSSAGLLTPLQSKENSLYQFEVSPEPSNTQSLFKKKRHSLHELKTQFRTKKNKMEAQRRLSQINPTGKPNDNIRGDLDEPQKLRVKTSIQFDGFFKRKDANIHIQSSLSDRGVSKDRFPQAPAPPPPPEVYNLSNASDVGSDGGSCYETIDEAMNASILENFEIITPRKHQNFSKKKQGEEMIISSNSKTRSTGNVAEADEDETSRIEPGTKLLKEHQLTKGGPPEPHPTNPLDDIPTKEETYESELEHLSTKLRTLTSDEVTELNYRLHENKNHSQGLHDFVKEYTETKAFKKYPVTSREIIRREIPVDNPKPQVDILKLGRKLIGTDITKVSLPSTLNCPLNMLMKVEEQFSYNDIFRRAARHEDPLLRLGLCMAAVFIDFGFMIGDRGKPFNPFMGETHELLWEDFRVISEQITQHPPCTALHAESNDYTIDSKFFFLFLKSTKRK